MARFRWLMFDQNLVFKTGWVGGIFAGGSLELVAVVYFGVFQMETTTGKTNQANSQPGLAIRPNGKSAH